MNIRTRFKKVGIVAVVLALSLSLSSCEFFRDLFKSAPDEVFYFRYMMVERESRLDGVVYRVPNARNANCGLYPMRLEDIARAVQQISGYTQLYDCAELYTTADREPALFDIDFKSTGRVQITVNRTLETAVSAEPTLINLILNSTPAINQRTNDGFATIDFGRGGEVFRCEGGNYPWHTNINNEATDTFFEFEISSRIDDLVSGNFACLARKNPQDPSDNRLLIILGGGFSMRDD